MTADATVPPAAQLRNADVEKAYLAIGTGIAFLVVVLIPYLAGIAGRSSDWLFQLGGRALALAALIYLTLTGVLRAREYYADVRASTWEGADGALDQVLAAQREAPAASGRSPRPVYRFGLGLAGVLLAPWLTLLFYADVLRSAGIVAAHIRRLPVIHALFGAFVCGAIIAACVLCLCLFIWGWSDPGLALAAACAAAGWAINAGGVVALGTGSLVSWAASRRVSALSPRYQPSPNVVT